MVKVSVICPVYNVEKYLDCCIESLVNQTYKNIEIILVDDGSSDESPNICDKWALRDDRIKVIHKNNGGVSSARNVGVKAAKGQYIMFVDSDDCLAVDAVEVLLRYQDKPNTIVVSKYDRFTEDDNDRGVLKGTESIKLYENPSLKEFTSIRSGCYIWGGIIPKKVIDVNEIEFNEKMQNLEDVAWLGIILCYIDYMVFVDANLYHYRENQTSITSNCTNYAWQAKCWIQVKKTVHKFFENKKKRTDREIEMVHEMDKLVKHNFYAECVVGKVKWKQVQNLCRGMDNTYKISKIEYYLYKIVLYLYRVLKK